MSCLKEKRFPRKFNFQIGYTFVANKKDGWMDEQLVVDWIKTVWKKVAGLSRKRSLLVWDSFRVHLSEPVKKG